MVFRQSALDVIPWYVSACHDRATLQRCPLLEELGELPMHRRISALRIELVYDRDCRNAERTRAMIKAALRDVGCDENQTAIRGAHAV
jgi:hypothetical protein